MTITRKFQTWRKVRQTRNALNSMSDRRLNDMGIARDDINRIARESI